MHLIEFMQFKLIVSQKKVFILDEKTINNKSQNLIIRLYLSVKGMRSFIEVLTLASITYTITKNMEMNCSSSPLYTETIARYKYLGEKEIQTN